MYSSINDEKIPSTYLLLRICNNVTLYAQCNIITMLLCYCFYNSTQKMFYRISWYFVSEKKTNIFLNLEKIRLCKLPCQVHYFTLHNSLKFIIPETKYWFTCLYNKHKYIKIKEMHYILTTAFKAVFKELNIIYVS